VSAHRPVADADDLHTFFDRPLAGLIAERSLTSRPSRVRECRSSVKRVNADVVSIRGLACPRRHCGDTGRRVVGSSHHRCRGRHPRGEVTVAGRHSRLARRARRSARARGRYLQPRLPANSRRSRSTLPAIIEFLQHSDRQREAKDIAARLARLSCARSRGAGLAILDPEASCGSPRSGRSWDAICRARSFVVPALGGAAVISDLHVAEPEVGGVVTIAYLTPVRDRDDEQQGVAILWLRAESLWNIARAIRTVSPARAALPSCSIASESGSLTPTATTSFFILAAVSIR
jgi:hypothetical protein